MDRNWSFWPLFLAQSASKWSYCLWAGDFDYSSREIGWWRQKQSPLTHLSDDEELQSGSMGEESDVEAEILDWMQVEQYFCAPMWWFADGWNTNTTTLIHNMKAISSSRGIPQFAPLPTVKQVWVFWGVVEWRDKSTGCLSRWPFAAKSWHMNLWTKFYIYFLTRYGIIQQLSVKKIMSEQSKILSMNNWRFSLLLLAEIGNVRAVFVSEILNCWRKTRESGGSCVSILDIGFAVYRFEKNLRLWDTLGRWRNPSCPTIVLF